jgi:hypothetical protein
VRSPFDGEEAVRRDSWLPSRVARWAVVGDVQSKHKKTQPPQQLLYGAPPAAMSAEAPCRESRFQVVPGSQALLEPQVPPKAVQQEREFPDVVKFSKAHDKGDRGSDHPATVALESPFALYSGRFELGLGHSMVTSKNPYADQCYGLLAPYGAGALGMELCLHDLLELRLRD